MTTPQPRLVVFTTVFPHSGQPAVGLFVRERMFRVARTLPLTVVAPVPWFPLQRLIRCWKPYFRPPAPHFEIQQGIEVRHPRFLSIPGAFKWLDGVLMALWCLPTMALLKRSFKFNVLDTHFAYPDGDAGTLLAKWLGVPATVTLRGTEVPLARDPRRRKRMSVALKRARRVFAVSDSLKQHAVSLGTAAEKVAVIGNGVDIEKFHPVARQEARRRLDLPGDAPIIVSVGALVERKGFHHVIGCLPALRRRFPRLLYLVAGGAGPEGDWGARLRRQARELQVQDCVRFLGQVAPQDLKVTLSAADAFVLATRNEGWANVFLEAMACGLPVVTTDVGGNAEVVADPRLGILVPYVERDKLGEAITKALRSDWDRDFIVTYARANSWEQRVQLLTDEFVELVAPEGKSAPRTRPIRFV